MERRSILIVDDSRTARATLKLALEGAGYEVSETSSGEDALIWLQQKSPQLVITDFNMDGMDGLALVSKIRDRMSRSQLPILVLTTETSDDLKRRGKAVGADGWLVKPFQVDKLRATVSYVLSRSVAP